MPAHQNRLAGETSPYLLQHASNPVDWYPWGPEALERAKREDKPILLSIGYSACHWCHVMERESFEDEGIAALMNAHFVCIKVDREERPDLDDIYMAATVAISGSGGWPMTVFLTPDHEAFFAGTYFPPTDKYGRPGFTTVLTRIADLWSTGRERLLAQASELTRHLRDQARVTAPAPVGASAIEAAVRQLARDFEPRFGGFSSAPKFPAPAALSLLLRSYSRSGDAETLRMVTVTLDGMKNGGLYDQIGGGFARYSTDERWLVPHFEKMLPDNAGLARAYLEAYQVTGDGEYRRIASETLDYVLREMQGDEGGYFSATDADSEGVEGKFFVWNPEQLTRVLGAEAAARFGAYYDISEGGNWEGMSIPSTPRPEPAEARALDEARRLVYAARRERVPPLLDDKVLTSWNALMIGAMSEGARVLGDARYRVSAERAAGFVLSRLRRPDGGLYRTARAGKAHLDGYLEDYAYLADALVDLYECGGSAEYLSEALRLAERALRDFGEPAGGAFYHTAHGHEALLVRTREGQDGAQPSPNAVAARALARLAAHFDRADLRERALGAVRAYGALIERHPRAFATALGVVDFLEGAPVELAFIGAPVALEREVAKHFLPNRLIAHGPGTLPLLEGKTAPGLYVCRNFVCEAPITEPGAVAGALAPGAASPRAPRPERLAGAATPEGTRSIAARHAMLGYAPLGRTGLTASRFGFGGYRIDDGDGEHRAALTSALRGGVNLLDTSSNYTGGRSERLIGQVLGALTRSGELAREEVIVVSKIGYVEGEDLAFMRQHELPETVKLGEQHWHSIHPDWLARQLGRSLERLELETLDVCLLHNPEYLFEVGAPSRDEYYGRLERAFAHLEREVARGRLRAYGVSSNTAGLPETHPRATSLPRLLEAARRAGGAAHHLRVLELPLNLLEPSAALARDRAGETVLDCAAREGVAVLVNRPLNAIVDGRLVRLAEPPALDRAPPLADGLDAVAELEREFARELAPQVPSARGEPPASELFTWAARLRKASESLTSLGSWRELEGRVIAPRISQAFRRLDARLTGESAERWRDWRGRYLRRLDDLMASLGALAAERSREELRRLARALDPLLPESRRAEPFVRKALWALASLPGVSAVLVGMRHPSYVADALEVMRWGALEGATQAFSSTGREA
ncbi:MAG: DUF255 domain-containing protein [Sorangiineae bacterium]|nr:DUF255 domain-containing protein [Polyangiaceae bacterium]MEB2321223.1 DUF255 domain-containing protein [Sorangiineae bacterium]